MPNMSTCKTFGMNETVERDLRFLAFESLVGLHMLDTLILLQSTKNDGFQICVYKDDIKKLREIAVATNIQGVGAPVPPYDDFYSTFNLEFALEEE